MTEGGNTIIRDHLIRRKSIYQTILAVAAGVAVWLSILWLASVSLDSTRKSDCPLEGLIPIVLVWLPLAFLGAGFSTGILIPNVWRVLRNLVIAIAAATLGFGAVLAFTGGGAIVLAIYGVICLVGLFIGYGIRRAISSSRRESIVGNDSEPQTPSAV